MHEVALLLQRVVRAKSLRLRGTAVLSCPTVS